MTTTIIATAQEQPDGGTPSPDRTISIYAAGEVTAEFRDSHGRVGRMPISALPYRSDLSICTSYDGWSLHVGDDVAPVVSDAWAEIPADA